MDVQLHLLLTHKKTQKATKLTVPTKKGYIFQGWYNGNNLTSAYDFNSQVISNRTLYAKWTKLSVPYTVTYTKDEGVSSILKERRSYSTTNSSCKVILPTITSSEGYSSGKWYMKYHYIIKVHN